MGITASIIIPTYNRTEIANKCISSVVECNLDNIEVIVVNDYKEGEFILSIKNKTDYIQVINNSNQGVASARNSGAKLARSNKLIFVDDDMVLNMESITSAINFLNNNSKAVYNVNWIYEPTLLKQISQTQFGRYLINHNFTSLKGWNEGGIEWRENSLLQTTSVTSQFLAINKTDFFNVGGYSEGFPFAGFEDHEFSKRLCENNFLISLDSSICIYHNEADRVEPRLWLSRKFRGAQSRKKAVTMGMNELELNYSSFKSFSYRLILTFKPLIFFFIKVLPNVLFFDFIYNKCINVLLGAYIYKGYKKA